MSTGPARSGLGVVNTVMENGPADFLNCTVPPSACAPVIPRTYPIALDNTVIAALAAMFAVNVFLCCRIKATLRSSHHHSAHLHGLKHNPYSRDIKNHG